MAELLFTVAPVHANRIQRRRATHHGHTTHRIFQRYHAALPLASLSPFIAPGITTEGRLSWHGIYLQQAAQLCVKQNEEGGLKRVLDSMRKSRRVTVVKMPTGQAR